MRWRKCIMTSINSLFVLTWRWWSFCWDNSLSSPYFFGMWDSRNTAQHYKNKHWLLSEELVPCRAKNLINISLVDRDRIHFPPLFIKLGLIKKFKAFDKFDGWVTYLWLHLIARIDQWEGKRRHLWRSSNPSAYQRVWDWKFNECGTGSVEGFCYGHKESSWQQRGEKLRRTCQQYAECFQKSWMQHQH